MREVKKRNLLFLVCAVFVFALLLNSGGSVWAADAAKSALGNSDCVKCHAAPPAALDSNGGKHKMVGCTGCHEGHKPAVKNNIPQCNQCHMGKSHFELKGCLGCHKNPHTPLKISFENNVTDACLTCHTKQNAQLKDSPSKHSKLYCSTCHTAHGKIPECLQCHKPHAADMAKTECIKCHRPHMPRAVSYAADIASKNCAACHKKAFDMLRASNAKHKSFECAFCHQEKHKMVPECKSCHGIPHPAGIMAKFTKCGDCHNIAHDLNHWPEAGKKAATEDKKAPVKAVKKKK